MLERGRYGVRNRARQSASNVQAILCLIAAFARAEMAARRIPTVDRTAVLAGTRVGSTGAGLWTQTVSRRKPRRDPAQFSCTACMFEVVLDIGRGVDRRFTNQAKN